jgi:hypothetical protein
VFVMARAAPILRASRRKKGLYVSHAIRLAPVLWGYAREEIIGIRFFLSGNLGFL